MVNNVIYIDILLYKKNNDFILSYMLLLEHLYKHNTSKVTRLVYYIITLYFIYF